MKNFDSFFSNIVQSISWKKCINCKKKKEFHLIGISFQCMKVSLNILFFKENIQITFTNNSQYRIKSFN